MSEGKTNREGRSLSAVVLLPAAVDGICHLAGQVGRWMWTAPLLAIPLCLLAARGQARLRESGLLREAEEPYGNRVGRWVKWHYLLWGLLLMTERGMAYTRRLTELSSGQTGRWLCLGLGFGLCLWLGRGEGAVPLRAGRVIYLIAAVALGTVALVFLPKVEVGYLLPGGLQEAAGLSTAVAGVVSLSGYAVYVGCLPIIYNKERAGGWTAALCGGLALLCGVTAGTLGAALTARLDAPLLTLLGRYGAPVVAVLILCDWMTLAVLGYGCGALLHALTGWGQGKIAVTAAALFAAGLLGEDDGARALVARWAAWSGALGGAVVPTVLLWWGRHPRYGRKAAAKNGDVENKKKP